MVMKLNELIKKIPRTDLIEVVTPDGSRAYYGRIDEIDEFTVEFFKGKEVEFIDVFMAEVGENKFEMAMQVMFRWPRAIDGKPPTNGCKNIF